MIKEKRHSVSINGELYEDIVSYCDINGINKNDFINDLLKESFIKLKYGDKPFVNKVEEKKIEPKVIKKVVEEIILPQKEEIVEKEEVVVETKPKKRKLN